VNQDLWQELLDEVAKHDVARWTWVEGHAGNPYNERCHELAAEASGAATRGGWAPPRRGR
jgi:ribonuclease HI